MTPDADLDDLVERARPGEPEGFSALIRACHVPVRALLAVLVHDRDEADDLAQQTFVFATEHLDDYRSGTRFLAWLKAMPTTFYTLSDDGVRLWVIGTLLIGVEPVLLIALACSLRRFVLRS